MSVQLPPSSASPSAPFLPASPGLQPSHQVPSAARTSATLAPLRQEPSDLAAPQGRAERRLRGGARGGAGGGARSAPAAHGTLGSVVCGSLPRVPAPRPRGQFPVGGGRVSATERCRPAALRRAAASLWTETHTFG